MDFPTHKNLPMAHRQIQVTCKQKNSFKTVVLKLDEQGQILESKHLQPVLLYTQDLT